jgi:hypothetical protein
MTGPPTGHEEIVFKEEMPMIACQMGQLAIAEWKENDHGAKHGPVPRGMGWRPMSDGTAPGHLCGRRPAKT